jgi:hypothetical protein
VRREKSGKSRDLRGDPSKTVKQELVFHDACPPEKERAVVGIELPAVSTAPGFQALNSKKGHSWLPKVYSE